MLNYRHYIQIMADYSIGEKILEERLYEAETSRPSEPEHIVNLKRGVVREGYELFLSHFGAVSISVSYGDLLSFRGNSILEFTFL